MRVPSNHSSMVHDILPRSFCAYFPTCFPAAWRRIISERHMGLMTFIVIPLIRRLYPSAVPACQHEAGGAAIYKLGNAPSLTHLSLVFISRDPWHTINAHQAHHRLPVPYLAHRAHSRTGLPVLYHRLRHYSRHQILVLEVRSSQAQ